MKRQDKSLLIDKLTKDFSAAKSITLIDFTGMNIKSQQDLKKKLKGVNARLIVAKNTLIKIAGTKAKFPKETLDDTVLAGQTAVVLADEDPVAPIQIVGKATTETETVKFKVGILDGVYQDKSAMTAISKLPSKEVLVGQTVGSIAGPMYGLINNLEAKMQELIAILNAKVVI